MKSYTAAITDGTNMNEYPNAKTVEIEPVGGDSVRSLSINMPFSKWYSMLDTREPVAYMQSLRKPTTSLDSTAFSLVYGLCIYAVNPAVTTFSGTI